MWAGCYSLDLYCETGNNAHKWDEFPHNYTDEKGSVCRAAARKAGWIIRRNGDAICPKCNPKNKLPNVKLTGCLPED